MAKEIITNVKANVFYIAIILIVSTNAFVYLIFTRFVLADTDGSFNTTLSAYSNNSDKTHVNLYAKAIGIGTDSLEERIAAAKDLAGRREADSWIALLLLETQLIQIEESMDKYEKERQKTLKPFELAVTAVTIRSLPENPGNATVWALTSLLSEKGVGRWSDKTGILLTKRINDYQSPPIREMARKSLKNYLKLDYKWDAIAWRKAILAKANDQTEE